MSDPRYKKQIIEIDQQGLLLESRFENFWATPEMILPGQNIEKGEEVDLNPELFVTNLTEPDEELPPLLFYDDGNVDFDEETAVIELLKAEALFCNQAKDPETVCLYVNCSDMFAWGCSDAERFPYCEIQRLWAHWKKDQHFGTSVWCMRQRGEMPQYPVARDIKKMGVWDLDAFGLAFNAYDKACQKAADKKKT